MPFESKESIRRVHSVVDQISASLIERITIRKLKPRK